MRRLRGDRHGWHPRAIALPPSASATSASRGRTADSRQGGTRGAARGHTLPPLPRAAESTRATAAGAARPLPGPPLARPPRGGLLRQETSRGVRRQGRRRRRRRHDDIGRSAIVSASVRAPHAPPAALSVRAPRPPCASATHSQPPTCPAEPRADETFARCSGAMHALKAGDARDGACLPRGGPPNRARRAASAHAPAPAAVAIPPPATPPPRAREHASPPGLPAASAARQGWRRRRAYRSASSRRS